MAITNPIHKKLLKILSQNQSECDSKEKDWVKKYLGTNKIYQGFSTKEMVQILNNIIKENEFDQNKLLDLFDSLYENATTYTEIALAAMLLGKFPKIRKDIDLKHLDNWLNYTCGWAENDLLCQSNFTAEEVLDRWYEWQKLLIKFSQDRNIHKRRASLVLLTKPLRQSDDSRLSQLAFEQVEKLKHEKEILITKAVSWVLRSLVKFHKNEVVNYLKEQKDTLPKIAYREAMSKAETGRKYNKKV
jgi:3-methyladenine DNA glycosylase AlkD